MDSSGFSASTSSCRRTSASDNLLRFITSACRRVASVAAVLITSFVLPVILEPAFGQEVCTDNSYLETPGIPAGSLLIAESAITYAKSNCPPLKSRLGQAVRLRAGQSLFFRFRLQGDTDYLSVPQSRYPVILNFYRDNGSVLVNRGVIDMDTIDIPAMTAEAGSAGGKFDWRLGGEKWRFDIPGSYQIYLTQQGRELQCAALPPFSPCRLMVEVLP